MIASGPTPDLRPILTVYDIIRWWLPIIGAAIGVIKTGIWIRNKVNETITAVAAWGDKALNNHLHSIEDNTSRTAAVLGEVRDNQAQQVAQIERVATAVAAVGDSLEKHAVSDDQIQHEILTGIEVLKDRN